MVLTATGLGRTGLQDWLIQRVTAIVLAGYTLFLALFFIRYHPVSYVMWRQLFGLMWVQFASLLAIIALCLHAWVGIWTVMTDYVKPLLLRLPLQVMIIMSLLYYVWWGIQILWSI